MIHRRTAVFTVLILLILPTFGRADMIVYSSRAGGPQGFFSDTTGNPPHCFDPSLGTLQSAFLEIELIFRIDASLTLEGAGWSAYQVNVPYEGWFHSLHFQGVEVSPLWEQVSEIDSHGGHPHNDFQFRVLASGYVDDLIKVTSRDPNQRILPFVDWEVNYAIYGNARYGNSEASSPRNYGSYSVTYTYEPAATVPEPSSLVMACLGATILFLYQKRRADPCHGSTT